MGDGGVVFLGFVVIGSIVIVVFFFYYLFVCNSIFFLFRVFFIPPTFLSLFIIFPFLSIIFYSLRSGYIRYEDRWINWLTSRCISGAF